MMTHPSRPLFALVLIAAVSLAACGGPSVEVGAIVKVRDITTGWFDAGIVSGMNKLVPSASFTVTNTGAVALGGLQVFSVFRFVGESEELGSSLVVLRGKDAIGPSVTSKPITTRANWGFTGGQPRGQMLMSRYFKDARVEIFVKYGSAPFVKIHESPITRQLLTQ
jgi:hypothetical protein